MSSPPNLLLPFRDALLPLIWPAITRINSALQAYPAFRIESCGLVLENDHVVVIALSAAKLDLPLDHVSLSFSCAIVCLPDSEPHLTCGVQWSRQFASNHRAGFCILESLMSLFSNSVPAVVKALTEHLPTCEHRMLEAVQRGGPPDEPTHLLHCKTRSVPPAAIQTLDRGTIKHLPDLKTFAATYDLQPD